MRICYNCSADHSAQWQDVELIFCQPTQHGNRRERRERVAYASLRPSETFIHVCLRPREAARFRVRKCANNCQLIVAGIQRFVRYAYAAHFRVILVHTGKTMWPLRTFIQTVIGVFFVHGNSDTHACLTQ